MIIGAGFTSRGFAKAGSPEGSMATVLPLGPNVCFTALLSFVAPFKILCLYLGPDKISFGTD